MYRSLCAVMAALLAAAVPAGWVFSGGEEEYGDELPTGEGFYLFHHRDTVVLPGNSGWMRTTAVLTQGYQLRVVATGRVSFKLSVNMDPIESYDADGDPQAPKAENLPDPGKAPFSLLGRLVDEKGQVVAKLQLGTKKILKLPASGRLEITANDHDKSDNTGSWQVYLFSKKVPSAGL